MKKIFLCSLMFIMCSVSAYADWGLVDSLNVAPFVPMVLDSLMSVAMSTYEFFVGGGSGIIYVMVWCFMAIFVAMYLLKMYFPKNWLGFFGMSGGGEMETGISGIKIGENLLKPAMRAIVAAAVLLPIKPQYITNFIIDPFLQFGAIYTQSITRDVFQNSPGFDAAPKTECPPGLITKEYMSKESCQFLVQPISDISHVNNQIIKSGLDFFTNGLSGLVGLNQSGGESFMNIITGLILVMAFVTSNFYMAFLIIQGIFDFGISLILYPFKVLTFVMKSKSDKWIDFWPPFEGIIAALKKLIITMIACAFVLAINIAVVKSLFKWNSSVFAPAGSGDVSLGFGQHSIVWLSALLTLFLMQRIFAKTQEKLNEYTGANDKLYKQVSGDAKNAFGYTQKVGQNAKKMWEKYIK